MTDPSTGQPAVTRLLDQQEAMQDTLTEVKVALARVETKLEQMCSQRQEQRQEHLACLAAREVNFTTNDHDHEEIWKAINRLTTWGKAIAIVGSILLTALGIISYLIAIGGRI